MLRLLLLKLQLVLLSWMPARRVVAGVGRLPLAALRLLLSTATMMLQRMKLVLLWLRLQ